MFRIKNIFIWMTGDIQAWSIIEQFNNKHSSVGFSSLDPSILDKICISNNNTTKQEAIADK